MLAGKQLTASPVEGIMEVVMVTVAVNPFVPAIVIVKLPVLLAGLNERMAELIVNGDADPVM
jgi:hypothetical protein